MGKKSSFKCPDCGMKLERKMANEVTSCRKCGKFICMDCAYEYDGVCRTCFKKNQKK